MAILTLSSDGLWFPSFDIEPVEFWPYATYVTDVVVSDSRPNTKSIKDGLIQMFKEAGIEAFDENKCAFGVKCNGKMWYLGFKDARFDIGMGIETSDWKTPAKQGEKPVTRY